MEMKLAKHADGCEEQREVKMPTILGEFVRRRGESRVGFWTSYMHLWDTHGDAKSVLRCEYGSQKREILPRDPNSGAISIQVI